MSKSKTNKLPWKMTNKRFVAFIDILGFKDLVMRSSHKDIYEQLFQISKTKQLIENLSDDKYFMADKGDSDTYILRFSDSIAIFSKTDDLANFSYFLEVTNYLFSRAINCKIPLKGGIALGIVSLNKTEQIYFGQPIIDAFLIEGEVKYMGIVAHNSIDKYLFENKNKIEQFQLNKILFEAKTPLKSGIINHLNLNWFNIIYTSPSNEEKIEFINSILKEFKCTVSGEPRIYLQNTVELFEENKNAIIMK
jgi:hypothetical protein